VEKNQYELCLEVLRRLNRAGVEFFSLSIFDEKYYLYLRR